MYKLHRKKKFLNIWEKLGEIENNYKEQADNNQQMDNHQMATRYRQPNKGNNINQNSYGQRQTWKQNPPLTQTARQTPNTPFKSAQNKPIHIQQGQYAPDNRRMVKQIALENVNIENDNIYDKEDVENSSEETQQLAQKNWQTGVAEIDQPQL